LVTGRCFPFKNKNGKENDQDGFARDDEQRVDQTGLDQLTRVTKQGEPQLLSVRREGSWVNIAERHEVHLGLEELALLDRVEGAGAAPTQANDAHARQAGVSGGRGRRWAAAGPDGVEIVRRCRWAEKRSNMGVERSETPMCSGHSGGSGGCGGQGCIAGCHCTANRGTVSLFLRMRPPARAAG